MSLSDLSFNGTGQTWSNLTKPAPQDPPQGWWGRPKPSAALWQTSHSRLHSSSHTISLSLSRLSCQTGDRPPSDMEQLGSFFRYKLAYLVLGSHLPAGSMFAGDGTWVCCLQNAVPAILSLQPPIIISSLETQQQISEIGCLGSQLLLELSSGLSLA